MTVGLGTIVRPGQFLAPQPEPIKGLLLDAATETTDVAWQDTVALYESFNCVTAGSTAVLPCPANLLTAPVQSASSTATTGGTLAAGTYRAVITAINSRGETVASNEISQVTTGATSTVTWNWAAVTGATGYRVYVTNAGAGTETFLVQVGAVTTYVWTGTPAYSAGNAAPPTTNTAVVVVSKTFQSSAWQNAIKFAVYTGVVCKLVGFDVQNAEAELERVFNNRESIAVARALMQQRFIASGGNWSAATDITPAAGAVDPSVGLALLESHAAANYAGQATIHMPRTIGSLVTRNGQAELVGNTLISSLGSKIAADPGYEFPNNSPTNTAPAAGELWVYASGEVTVAASEVVQKSGLDLVETTDSNRFRILRERMYLATVDCYTAAVRVKVQ